MLHTVPGILLVCDESFSQTEIKFTSLFCKVDREDGLWERKNPRISLRINQTHETESWKFKRGGIGWWKSIIRDNGIFKL